MVGVGSGRWWVSNVFGDQFLAFLLVGGRFLFSRMVGSRCFNHYVLGARLLIFSGRWFVVSG